MKNLLLAFSLAVLATNASAFCFKEAAERYRVSPALLVAIAKTESQLNPDAIRRNKNGTEDIGLMQINTSWLPKLRKFGIDRKRLKDPCINANVGAWILAENIIRHGRTWQAVGVYHSPTEERQVKYVRKVWDNLKNEG